MGEFLRTAALVMVAVVLGVLLNRDNKHMAVVLAVIACCAVAAVALSAVSPVITFLQDLQKMGKMDDTTVGALLKAVGIGLVTQISVLICNDASNAALGKTLQLLGTATVLAVSIPLFRVLMELIQRMLGEL